MVFRIIHTGLTGLLVGLIAAACIGPTSGLTGCSSRPTRVAASQDNMMATPSNSSEDEEEDEAPSVAEEMTGTGIERSSTAQHSNFMFDWPVNEARLTRGFLPLRKKRPHLGIDLAAPKGTPILAAHEGTVIYTGHDFRGYGKMVMLEGHEGLATLYAHLSKITVEEGQKVTQGYPLGEMGRTGRATGTHLHFEVRTDRGPVDPLNYLPNGALVAKLVGDRKKAAR